MDSSSDSIGLLLAVAFFYFIPAIIAFRRKHANKVPVLLVNIFFGWTVLGWIIALIWSFSANIQAERQA